MQNVQAATVNADDYQSNEPDSLFGVCQSIGEDFGFNPFFLRVALLGLLFFSPLAVIAAYAALAVAVGASRWLFPKAKAEAEIAAVAVIPSISVASHSSEEVEPTRELIAA